MSEQQSKAEGCRICPRECGALRREGRPGRCGMTQAIRVARASLHMWEEPCISGEKGSGTVFFSGCPLGCVYCQNRDISRGIAGRELSVPALARLFVILQEQGAANINLVTPTHYSLLIREAVLLARKQGLHLPVVYNCSGYEKPETLRQIADAVDIYLTDFKYADSALAEKYSGAPDYPVVAAAALEEMVRQQPRAEFDEEGMLTKGVILRHLLLPGALENGFQVLRQAFSAYGNRIYYSLMNQYTPMQTAEEGQVQYPELQERVTESAYEALIDYALDLGVENGFIQEGETAEESFIPDFAEEGFLRLLPPEMQEGGEG